MRLPFASNSGPTTKALTLRLDPDDDEAERKERMAVERRTELEVRRELARVAGELFPPGSEPSNAYAEAVRAGQMVTGEKMRDVLSRALQDSADLGVSVAVRQFDNVGYGFDYMLANESARAWALRYTDDVLAQLGTTTQRIVGQAVGRWVGNGEPLSSLVKDLRPAFGKQRATVIAATEVTRAYAEGSKEAYIASGVVKKLVWQTANDERRCVYCGGLQGKVVGIEESFDTALPANLKEKARPFALPPAHPGCRCWVNAVVEGLKRNRKPKTPKQPAPARTEVAFTGDVAALQRARFTQDKIAELFDIGPSAKASIVIRGDSNEIEIAGTWTNRDTGEMIGECTRRLFPNERNAYLDVLAFEPGYIGNGAGMKVARQWFDALNDAGYEKAELYAGLSVGRYAWAKEGAKYIDRTQAARSTALFREWVAGKNITLADNEYPTFTSVLDVATYTHPRGLTLTGKDIVNNSVPADMVLPLGKAFMLDIQFNGHGGWNGVIDLNARASKKSAKSAPGISGKATGQEMAYINGTDDSQSDALFFAAYLVDDDTDVAPLLGGDNAG